MNCICSAPGFCPLFGKRQSERMHAICRNQAEGLSAEQCETYRSNWSMLAIAKGHLEVDCIHRGEGISTRTQKVEKKGCGSCAQRGDTVTVYDCKLKGQCTILPWQVGQPEAVCRDCTWRRSAKPRLLDRRRIEPSELLSGKWSGFNNSLLKVGNKLLMAYRVGWDDARIAIAELSDDLHVTSNSPLALKRGLAQEDPRLFLFRGEPHVSYTAVSYGKARSLYTDICYARIEKRGDAWTVADEFFPKYPQRNYWEKNWGFFDYRGDLHCVYSIKPHRVLKIEGNRAELVAETECDFDGKQGLLHGGAPPFFHRGEWYSFYHARRSDGRLYSMDLYTFEDRPPFRPSRHIEPALLMPSTPDQPAATIPHCVFPGGSFIDDQHRWIVSFGYYDKWCEVAWFDINDVEQCLTPLAGGPLSDVKHRRGTSDLAIWKEVAEWNQYGLPERFESSDVIVDVGAHIGAFSRACLDRGAGRVIAVEPYPPSFDLLRRNCPECESNIAAVGSSIGTIELCQPDPTGTSVVGVSAYRGGPIAATANQFPLSYLLPAGPIRLLKLDCEGAEYDAIASAGEALDRVQEIVGEVHRIEVNGQTRTISDFSVMLFARGFTVESKADSEETWIFRATRTTGK